jgi:hypothetical protein
MPDALLDKPPLNGFSGVVPLASARKATLLPSVIVDVPATCAPALMADAVLEYPPSVEKPATV